MFSNRGVPTVAGLLFAIACGMGLSRPAAGGQARDPAVAETVALDDKTVTVAKLVAGGQSEIPKLIAALSAQPPEKPGAEAMLQIQALRQLGAKEAVPVLINVAFKSADQEVAREAWVALGDLAAVSDLPALLPILDAPRELAWKKLYAQKAAVAALAAISSRPGAAAKVVELITAKRFNSSPISRIRQIDLLGTVHNSAARNLLCTFFEDGDADVKRTAIDTVDFVESTTLRNELVRLLDSPDTLLQKAAILCVGRSGMISTVPKLVTLLDSKAGGVKDNASWSLARLIGKKFSSAEDARLWLNTELQSGDAKFERLKQQLTTVSVREMPLVIEDLSKLALQREKVTALLMPLLQHKEPRVRAAACEALSQSSAAFQTLRSLVFCLRDPSDMVAASAWRALKELSREQLPRSPEVWQKWLDAHGY